MSQWRAMLAASLPLAVLLGAAVFLDLAAAASTNQLFLGGVGALGLLAAAGAGAWTRRAECLLPLLPFTVLLVVLPLIDTSPLKPFAWFYAAIEPGMTEAEILGVLDDQFPPGSRHPRPLVNQKMGPTHLGFILDPRDGRYDAEIVVLDFEGGQVVGKQYYPD